MSNFKVDSCWCSIYKNNLNTDLDFLIVKCHHFDIDLCNISTQIFLPLRDFRDSALSCNKRYKNLNTLMDFENFILQEIDQYESWEQYASHIFKYENYIEDKINNILEIIHVLGLDKIDINLLLQELDDLHNGKNCPVTDILPCDEYDLLMTDSLYKRTLMTKSHNTSGGKIYKYKTEMSKDILTHLNNHERIKQFLNDHGYLTL
jgi:hypothetical protein